MPNKTRLENNKHIKITYTFKQYKYMSYKVLYNPALLINENMSYKVLYNPALLINEMNLFGHIIK